MMLHVRRFIPALGITIAILAGLFLLTSIGNAQTESADSTPQPTPSPPDLSLAAQLARDGDVDAATNAYLATIDQGTGRERLAARLPLARVYLDDGQLARAAQQLDALLLEAPATYDVRPAQFLLAETLSLRGEWEDALHLYDAYLNSGGGASDYARLGRAEALAHLGRVPEANADADAALGADLPVAAQAAFELAMAQALQSSSPGDALEWYARLQTTSDAPADQALVLWQTAKIRRDLGDSSSLQSAATTLVEQYRDSAQALEAVESIADVKSLGPYTLGLVYYNNGQRDKARLLFEQQIQQSPKSPDAARAYYYIAVIEENAGDTPAAIDDYARVLDTDATIELADDASWWHARLLQQTGRVAEAQGAYQDLRENFPASEFAPEAAFRSALIDYDAARYDEAATAFAGLASASKDSDRARGRLWQGKALEKAGDNAAARDAWHQVINDSPDEYYGLRAAVLAGDANSLLADAGLRRAPSTNWEEIEAWLATTTGKDPSLALDTLLYDNRWGLGQELLALGMRRRAAAVFEGVLESAGADPQALYQLCRSLDDAGLSQLSARAATRLLFALPDDARASAPDSMWKLAYPAPFARALREASDEEDVPDLLVLAMVRQESFFDPLAGSSAGALGLTQVVPDTGEVLADHLGMRDFVPDDLYRPIISLRFGARYLREQLDAYDGNIYSALAAYNAGPASVTRWREASGDDVDRFVEEIDFAQTKAYIELVLENLAYYRMVYQGLDRPELPAS